jgi:hypothetical protein
MNNLNNEKNKIKKGVFIPDSWIIIKKQCLIHKKAPFTYLKYERWVNIRCFIKKNYDNMINFLYAIVKKSPFYCYSPEDGGIY